MNTEFKIRSEVNPEDTDRVREIVASTNFFHHYEIDIAVELVHENLATGDKSGYNFLFVEIDGKTVAYSCFGLIPCTESSFDLYWIVVHSDYRGLGIGKHLLRMTEQIIKSRGGTAVYAETSSVEKYRPTRNFYRKSHYFKEATLKNYYRKNDSKVIYSKQLTS